MGLARGLSVALRAAAVACAAAVLSAPAAPPRSADKSEQELRELRGRIEKLQADLAAAEKSSGEAAD
jgi:hypothetical protein